MSVPLAPALMYLRACISGAFLYLSVAPLASPWLDYCAKGCLASWFVCVSAKSLQSCPTLCDPMGYSLPGSYVHGTLQERILEWVCHFLFQGIFLTQGLNLPLFRFLLDRQILYYCTF